jgi:hypothetical protein
VPTDLFLKTAISATVRADNLGRLDQLAASRRAGDRDLAFVESGGPVLERGGGILGLEVGVVLQQLVTGSPRRELG